MPKSSTRHPGGRPSKVPLGDGERRQIAVRIGADLLAELQAAMPGLNASEALRAAALRAVGRPERRTRARQGDGLLALAGILTEEEGDALEAHVSALRGYPIMGEKA